MDLQLFIEETIREVTAALHNSSEEMIKAKTGKGIPDHDKINVTFDIAVTVSESSEKNMGAKISVLGNFGVGAGSKAGSDVQQVSRLNFIVPIKISTINSSGMSFSSV